MWLWPQKLSEVFSLHLLKYRLQRQSISPATEQLALFSYRAFFSVHGFGWVSFVCARLIGQHVR